MDIFGWVLYAITLAAAVACLICMSILPREAQQVTAKNVFIGVFVFAVIELIPRALPPDLSFMLALIGDGLAFSICLVTMQTIEDGRMQRKNRER